MSCRALAACARSGGIRFAIARSFSDQCIPDPSSISATPASRQPNQSPSRDSALIPPSNVVACHDLRQYFHRSIYWRAAFDRRDQQTVRLLEIAVTPDAARVRLDMLVEKLQGLRKWKVRISSLPRLPHP